MSQEVFRAVGPINDERTLRVRAFAKNRQEDAGYPARVEIFSASGEALFGRSGVAHGLGAVGRSLTVSVSVAESIDPFQTASKRYADIVRLSASAADDDACNLVGKVFPAGAAGRMADLYRGMRGLPEVMRNAAKQEIERLTAQYGEAVTVNVVLGRELAPVARRQEPRSVATPILEMTP